MKRVILYGGTFDPPHNGHRHLLEGAMRHFGISEAIVMPTAIPPHKSADQCFAPMVRKRAVELLMEGLSGVTVSDYEITKNAKSYTVDTLRHLKKEMPDTEICFLMGSDMFLTLAKWWQAEEILRTATILAAAREEEMMPKMQEYRRFLLTIEPTCDIMLFDIDILPVSSSEIRAGENTDMVPRRVWKYLQEYSIVREN